MTAVADVAFTVVSAAARLGGSGSGSLQGGLQGGGRVTTRAHLLVGIITIASLLFIVRLVRRKGLKSKYSLLWLSIGIIMGTIAAFPGLLAQTSYKLGIYYPPATFLAFSVAFLFLVVVQFSWELSRLEDRTRTLAEELALLRAAHDKLAQAVGDAVREPEPDVEGSAG